MTDILDLPDIKYKISLSIPFVAKYLKAGRTQAEIARIANCSPQWVNEFIYKHYEVFEPLLDNSDTKLADELKLNAVLSAKHTREVLQSPDFQPTKKDFNMKWIV